MDDIADTGTRPPEPASEHLPEEQLPAELERRLVLRALGHWRDAKGEKRLPTLADLDLDSMPEIWDCACLLSIDPERDFVIERTGEAFQSYAPIDMAGRALADLPTDTLVAHFTAFAAEVADREVPITRGGSIPSDGEPVVLYRSIILPVTKTTGELKWLLVVANWREVVAG